MSGLNAGEKLEGWATAKTCDQTLPDYITNWYYNVEIDQYNNCLWLNLHALESLVRREKVFDWEVFIV
jgi:hypothetical protein